MKNRERIKKILALSTMGLMSLAMPFALTGCDKDRDINVRVENNYIQWQEEGDNDWNNLLSVDEVKDLLKESCKGEQGNPGINGREVEFNVSDTHIQWRYVGDTAWKNLVSFNELLGENIIDDQDELNQRGFQLFQSKLDKMNNNYKVIYDYADKYIVESFSNFGFVLSNVPDGWNGNILSTHVSMEYDYNAISHNASEDEWYKSYSLNINAKENGDWIPYNMIGSSFDYKSNVDVYKYLNDDYFRHYNSQYSAAAHLDYNFVKVLKQFNEENLIDCKFNENGDCVISFSYSGNISSEIPYLNSDFVYDFYVKKDGEILKCNVYEKGFLDENKKGDLYCKISYKQGESLITNEMIEDCLKREKEKNSQITGWFDVFDFRKSE